MKESRGPGAVYLPPIKKVCPVCFGEGVLYSEPDCKGEQIECFKCHGDKEVWNHLTPEQWEAETGNKLLASDPVWVFFDYQFKDTRRQPLLTITLEQWGYACDELLGIDETAFAVIARIGQPKPSADWRPEK